MSDIPAFLAWARNDDASISPGVIFGACDEIETLVAENQLLRLALQAIINRLSEGDSWLASHLDAANIAREALSKMDSEPDDDGRDC